MCMLVHTGCHKLTLCTFGVVTTLACNVLAVLNSGMVTLPSPMCASAVLHTTCWFQIAIMELREKKIPFTVRRYLPDGRYTDTLL